MAGIFDSPKIQTPAVPNPGDTQNRLADALTRQLSSGGTNADLLAPSQGVGAGTPGARPPALTGLN